MFNWLFKRRGSADARNTPSTSTSGPAKSSAAPAAGGATKASGAAAATRGGKARPGTATAAAAVKPTPQPALDWPALLQAAQGDDAALLALTQQGGAPLDVKLAAVQALAGEDALKQAERAFRSHDRKVHQLARKRLDVVVARREARAAAASLLARAAALLGEDEVAINHVVTLDRAWQALPADLLEPAQPGHYTDLRAQLDQHIRTHTEARQHEQRWVADARRVLETCAAALRSAAEQGSAADVAALRLTLQALADTRPDTPATAAPAAALAQALQCAHAVQQRLDWLDADHPTTAPGAGAAPRDDRRDDAANTPTGDPVRDPAGTAAADASAVPAGLPLGAKAIEPTGDTVGDPADASAVDPTGDHTGDPTGDPTGDRAGAVDAPSAAVAAVTWDQLAPLPDAELTRVLGLRREAWRKARQPSSAVMPVGAQPVRPQQVRAAKTPRAPQAEALSAEQLRQVEALVQQAQVALEAGQLGELRQHLAAVDAALGDSPLATLPEALRADLLTLRGEGARLKGWQQWGGGRARDDLTEEAEALARTTQAADDPEQPDAPKVDVKDQRERIQALRTRWKELDRLGAPASQTLWQRFDAALQTASAPVAAHHAVLMAQRRENLAVREALLATLEALSLDAQPQVDTSGDANVGANDDAGASDNTNTNTNTNAAASAPMPTLAPVPASQPITSAAAGGDGPGPGLPQSNGSAGQPPDWRGVLRELGNFQAAWRKLGPVEHTVPAEARDALQRRHRAAVDRLEAPLDAARRQAAAQREQLIRVALALVPAGAHQRPLPDSLRQVRELQARWQDHARSLPLARAVENELWAGFKAATDAVFNHRDAAFAARDAELAGNLGACEALIERLAALGGEATSAEIERTLTEVDRAWRQTGELPRQAADAVERRFRAAHGAAVDLLHSYERRHWQAQCDTLAARLALCEARESGAGTSEVDRQVDAAANTTAAELPAAEPAAADPAAADPAAADPAAADTDGAHTTAADTTTAAAGSTAATLQQRWTALADLPSPWRQALAQRWDRAARGGPLAPAEVDRLLLQVEAALDVPTAPQWEAERRQLKLRALKDAMEGRRSDACQPADALLGLLRQAGLSAGQRPRLHALVAALRQAPPGAIGTPTPRG